MIPSHYHTSSFGKAGIDLFIESVTSFYCANTITNSVTITAGEWYAH